MNLARLFSAYRLLERQASRERVQHRAEVFRLRAELLEWQNVALKQARLPALFQPPPVPTPPTKTPPVGLAAKRAYVAENTSPSAVPTAEQILASAAARKNGNQ